MDAICRDCLVTKPLTEYYQIYRHCPIKVCKECYKTKQKIVYKQRYIKKEKTKSLRSKTIMMVKVDFDNIADFGMLSIPEFKQMIQKIREEMIKNESIIKIIKDEITTSEKNRNYKIL
jgi:hypothetical protein